ncbi:class I SAM-dependent methyltransferase [Rhodopila globiformis]|uniref:class I SAM-dependent methyltransferase n=1 Tax=Rhodopila globiformis TaxID=1071 RepID=UPI0011B0717C|nr:methyltransferase domain-containing protein [Rhodopila globiformis]
MKVNLGCGQNKLDGYINVDKYDSFAPEIVWDLESFPWPFENDSVDEIVMRHCLEHLGAAVETFLSIMKELYRICAPGARIFIAVPHPRSDGFAGDPTHVRAISPPILSLFSKKNNHKWKELGWPNTPLGVYTDVDFEIAEVDFALTPHWARQYQSGQMTREGIDLAIGSYFNVVDEVKITLVACK